MSDLALVMDAQYMEKSEILKAVIINVLNLDIQKSQILAQTNLFDLGIDSMSIVSLVVAIEEEFGVSLPESELSATMFERFSNLLSIIVENKGD